MADSASMPSNTTRPGLSKVFSGHHLDDQSTYHARDSVSEKWEHHRTADEESDLSGETADDEDKEARGQPFEETVESQNAAAALRDPEAPLGKKQSTKSVKDPDLVSV